MRAIILCVVLLAGWAPAPAPAAALPEIHLPRYRLEPRELAVIVNDDDPLSRRIGRYYAERRGIPPDNLIHVRMDPAKDVLPEKAFDDIYAQVRKATPPHVQAYAITWTKPYRVACMSITTAFAAGFDRTWCSRKGCSPTRRSPYFDSPSRYPFRDFGLRPTMMIAARTFEDAVALVERGIAADESWPRGSAYLLKTSDKARSVRAALFPFVTSFIGERLPVVVLEQDALRNRDDVLFYFTGRPRIEGLDTLKFLPGAVADHLTSFGGRLGTKKQMTVMAWLKAGATGSYGTVVEPCNLLHKFPHPGALMEHYLAGATLVEAYWKSVSMPGEGLFVGEPLAAPFAGQRLSRDGQGLLLETWTLQPGRYRLLGAASPIGPFRNLGILQVRRWQHRFHLPDRGLPHLRLTPLPTATLP